MWQKHRGVPREKIAEIFKKRPPKNSKFRENFSHPETTKKWSQRVIFDSNAWFCEFLAADPDLPCAIEFYRPLKNATHTRIPWGMFQKIQSILAIFNTIFKN